LAVGNDLQKEEEGGEVKKAQKKKGLRGERGTRGENPDMNRPPTGPPIKKNRIK